MRYLDKRVERICDELYRLRIVQRMEWTERGPVRATLEIERKVSRSVICQKIHFYAACPRIDFETTVDWKEHRRLYPSWAQPPAYFMRRYVLRSATRRLPISTLFLRLVRF